MYSFENYINKKYLYDKIYETRSHGCHGNNSDFQSVPIKNNLRGVHALKPYANFHLHELYNL